MDGTCAIHASVASCLQTLPQIFTCVRIHCVDAHGNSSSPMSCHHCHAPMEDRIGHDGRSLTGSLAEKMFHRWHTIFSELAVELGYGEAAMLLPDRLDDVVASDSPRWRTLLDAFGISFPTPPKAQDVLNWNSVHKKRSCYRGIIRRSHHRFLCTIVALEESQVDGISDKSPVQSSNKYICVDWTGELADGDEVTFVAF